MSNVTTTAKYKVKYFKDYNADINSDKNYIDSIGNIIITIQHFFLDYVGLAISMARESSIFDQKSLVDPRELRDCCKTVLSLIGNNVNHFRLERIAPHGGEVLQIIRRMQELSEEGYYVMFVMVD